MFLSVLLLILLISAPCSGQTPEVRRGLKSCEKIRSEMRAIHDSIAFIENTYRKKDAAYADFSIQQQQHLLQRLTEEWSRSGCGETPRRVEKAVFPVLRSKDSMIESTDQIWEVGHRRWTIEEERQFEKWVEENITEDFFIHHRLPTDCADAVYAIRWIYARIVRLPAAATTKEGKLIGHWSTEWKHLPTHPEWNQDERFRASLLYLFPRTWTGTLRFDTYPVRISPEALMPGTLFLMTEAHTGVIGKVCFDGSSVHPLQTWESALPVKIQKLSSKFFFMGTPQLKNGSGLVKFRWPVAENGEWKYLPANEHPFYSEEQYASNFYKGHADFVEAVAKKVDPVHRAPMEKLVKVMGTVTRLLKERVPIVLEGYRGCLDGSCPEGSEWWEIHTTTGRDETIALFMGHLSQIIESNHLNRETVKKMMEAISIEISKNRSVTFYQVFQNYLWLSPHPEDSIEARWGLKKCEMIDVRTRATKDSIAFIEKTYRRNDPKYADFSVRQQQFLLRRLNEEWATAQCVASALAHEKRTQGPSLTKDSTWAGRKARKCESIRADIQAANDSISFIEKTYREKDPRYADFSVGQQQNLLLRLNEEWTIGRCTAPTGFGCKEPLRSVKKK